ncbi:MAG: hypothetical protein QME96_15965, partial [Myxococcota bacterium]|nr:hypothetical protein [Myxococcota bacterium]
PAAPQAPPPPTGGLCVEGAPDDALLVVDERVVGPVGAYREVAAPLRPGIRRVEVIAPGWFPWFAEVEIGDEVTTIAADPRPVPR